MIRRWSRLISIESNSAFFTRILFKRRFKSFRKSIIFRKFFLKYSKLLRKHYARLKHSYNWIIYTQIWQHWISDFLKIKNIIKFHFFKKMNPIERLSYDPYRFSTKQQKLSAFVSHVSCGLTKRLIFWNSFIMSKTNSPQNGDVYLNFYNNTSIHFSYLLESHFTFSLGMKPLYTFINNHIASPQTITQPSTELLPVFKFYSIIFQLCLQLLKEFYTLNLVQWLRITYPIINVK